MYPSTTPNKDIEVALEQLKGNPDKDKIKKFKKESDAYCSDCLTKKDKYYLPAAGVFCECGKKDFMENGKEKYPHIYKEWKKMTDALCKDAGFNSDEEVEE